MRLKFVVKSDPVLKDLAGAHKRFITRAKIVMGRNAGITKKTVELTAPRDTNFMAEHVEIDRFDDGLGYEVGWHAEVFIAESVSHEFYPPHVEEGTEWTPAQPSLGPAHERQTPVVIRGVRRIMEDMAEGK